MVLDGGILEALTDAVVGARDGLIVFVNARAQALFGYARDELIGQPVELLVPPAYRDAHAQQRSDFVRERRTRALGRGALDLRGVRRDGSEFPADIALGTVETTDGPCVVAVIRDLTAVRAAETARAEAERALRRSEARYRALLDQANDAVYVVDARGTIVEANRAAEAQTGRARSEIVGRPYADMLAGSAAQTAADGFQRVQDAGTVRLNGIPIVLPDGTAGIRDVSAARVDFGSGSDEAPVYLAIVRDVTEHTRAQAQLLASDRMASIGMLAAGLAHEINNPLAAAIASVDHANNLVAGSPLDPSRLDELRATLDDAREASSRVRQVVRDLKLFSRADDERVGPVDLHPVLDSAARLAWTEVRHRARLVKDYGTPPIVHASQSRLGQVFLNLLVNAAQSIAEGRAAANEIRIVTRAAADGRAAVEVRDTGSGMTPDVRARVFTPFFTTKPAGVGTGLGLAICQRIVAAAGGEIQCESAAGRGTTFRVLLPAARQPQRADRAATPLPGPARIRGRVLVVDDDPHVCGALRRTLGSEHDLEAETDARAALVRLEGGERFDVILCDLMMPEMTGMDFHERVVAAVPQQAARMIFLTGGAFTPRAHAFLERVAAECVEKPFDLNALRALVNARVRAERAG